MSSSQPTKTADRSVPAGKRRGGPPTLIRPDILLDGEKGTRLQKFLAISGVESRRNCEDFIRDGRITIDGKVVTNPAVSVHPERQDVRLDGERLKPSRYRYYLLHKPKGVVCTTKDPANRPLAVNCVPSGDDRMFTVGRLDENTTGLLLVTNDGALAEHLAHPRYEVTRRYKVQVVGIPDAATLAELKKGMHFSDGYFHFQSVRILKRRGRSTFLELELREGKNREIRRLLARTGHKVIQLERVAFGPLKIGQLESGQCRELRPQEVRDLYKFIQDAPSVRRAAREAHAGGEKKSPAGDRRPAPKKAVRKKKAAPTREAPPSKRGAARYGIKKRPVKKKAAGKRRPGKK
jgi:23S rRNA pseudouridine2605 synthase